MGCAEYRMYLNGSPATADQLARFEDITIEQEMDMAWEARIQAPLCVDSLGNWDAESEAFLAGMSRIRIEVSMAGGPWAPLIDGTITNQRSAMMSEPGMSMLTLVVTDDSFYLHRDETVRSYQGVSDDQIATQIFEQVSQLACTDVDTVPAASNPGHDTTVLRGTEAELLQQLAQRQHMHAYVLPGPNPGQSIGCFKRDPDPNRHFGLTPLVLTGAGRNMFQFESDNPAGQTAVFQSSRINLNDRSTDPRTADPSQILRYGTDPTQGPSVKRIMRPGQSDNVDNNQAVQSASQRASFVMKAHGEVMKDTYLSILQPYKNVQVQGVNGRLSGTWLIQQVTHTLTRNSYGQTFKMIRNAQSAGDNNAAPSVPAQAF
jgi:hypothetical protein